MDRAWLLATLAAGAIACSATGGNSGSSAGGAGAATTTSPGGGGSAGGGGSEPQTPYCYTPCLSVDDCAVEGVVAYDANHWTCDQGSCNYLGCFATSECEAVFPGYVCAPSQEAAVPQCVRGCSVPADCALPNAGPLYDADHSTCDDGACY